MHSGLVLATFLTTNPKQMENKTAVEFLIEQQQKLLADFGGMSEEFEALFEEALKMEKQIIENAYFDGGLNYDTDTTSEQYYYRTFKK